MNTLDTPRSALGRQPILFALESDRSIATVIDGVAADAGFQCHTFANCRGLLDGLRNQRPDIVSLDLQLDDEDCLELLRLLLGRRFPCPIIVASGIDCRVLDALLVQSPETGLNIACHIRKPFDPAEFATCLASASRNLAIPV